MIAAVNNAEETLSWLEHSKEVISKNTIIRHYCILAGVARPNFIM